MDKKGRVIIESMVVLLVGAIGITSLLFLVDPLRIKQEQFTFELHDHIPTDPKNYIDANDNVLSAVTMNFSNVDTNKVGTYEVSAQYLGKEYFFNIQIKDTVKPIAKLVQTKYEIYVNETLYAKDMVKDVVEDSSYHIYFDEEGHPESKTFTEAKVYNNIYIIVEDEHGNKSQRLRVSVSVKPDNDKPILRGIRDSVIPLYEPFDPYQGVEALDKTDGNITNRIDIHGDVNTNQPGIYQITYKVTDSSGNTTIKMRKIVVES